MKSFTTPSTLRPLRVLIGCTMALSAFLPDMAQASIHKLKPEEMKLFRTVVNDPGQRRKIHKLDPILCVVARQRALDMARRDYFNHVNPDGHGPDYLVRKAGYILPYKGTRTSNHIESIALAPAGAQRVLNLWKDHAPHADHILGRNSQFVKQTRIGVGIVQSKKNPQLYYFVFLSAPPNPSDNPPYWVLKNPSGGVIATTGSPPTSASEDLLMALGARR